MKKTFLLLWVTLSGLILFSSCSNQSQEIRSDIYDTQRRNMVRWLALNGIESPLVLEAMRFVPRHLFLPEQYQEQAYQQTALPIGQFASTPQPFVVAKTIELLGLTGKERVLEVGTGLGYQSAILAELAREVYTIEIVPEIAQKARNTLNLLYYHNVKLHVGDGYKGWPEFAPFDAILVMASAEVIPEPLKNQLVEGGILVMPLGTPEDQSLIIYKKEKDVLIEEAVMSIKLKAMEGRARE